MPVSASQHRTSSGIYQNKLYDKVKINPTLAQSVTANYSTIPDEICLFGNHINRAINSSEDRFGLSPQNPGIVVPLLLLLSQVRLTEIYVPPVLIADKGSSISFSENTILSEDRGNFFNALLNPVANALYETGEMISRYDPLKFPGADAVSLSVTTPESLNTLNRHFLSENLSNKINELISTITEGKQKVSINKMVDELNNIVIEAEKKFPSSSPDTKSIEHLIYLIDNSKNIIDKFEIKYGQETLCKILNLQKASYIKMAHNISDEYSQSIFQQYVESLPPLIFTPDSRGDAYPSVESQISGNLVRGIFGFEHALEDTNKYDSRYEAYKSLLTFLLAEKNIGSVNNLPTDWDKGDEALRLVNLLLRDFEFKLQNKREMYLLPSAEIFYLSYRESLIQNSTLSTLDRKLLLNNAGGNKLLFLREHLKKSIKIEYNQQPDSVRFIKLLDLLVTIQCITEVMYDSHLPDIRTGRSDQKCKNVENLKLEYNSNTQELTIHATSGKIGKLKENNAEMAKILSENKTIGKIKFKPILSLRRVKNRSSISKQLKNRIRPEMYAKNIKRDHICGVDDMGLRYDGRGNTYLRINKHFVKTTRITSRPEINNRYYIRENQNKNLYLRFREDEKFHLENITERLNINKMVDSVGITSNERYALHTYGLTGDNNIKKFMREGMPENYSPPESRESMVKIIDDIQNALPKIPPYELNVFKAITTNKETLNSLKKNQLVTSKIFLCCTKHPGKARKFSTPLINHHNVDNNHHLLIKFNIIKSGHSVEWYTEKFDEEEVLIESNQYFNIRKIKSNSPRESLVILDEIDSSLLSTEEKALAKNIDF